MGIVDGVMKPQRQLDLGWLLGKPRSGVELTQTMIDMRARVVMPMLLRIQTLAKLTRQQGLSGNDAHNRLQENLHYGQFRFP